MSVVFNSECILCHLRRNVETARRLGTEEQATAFTRELLKMYLSAPEGVGSPWFGPRTTDLLHEMYGLDLDRYRKEKEESNRFVLARLDQIRSRVEAAEDPVYAGLQFSVLGNYIDFSALQDEIDFDRLDEMLTEGEKLELDRENYVSLCAELEAGKELLYLTDNAGEIGFDRVLAEQIHKKYPHVNITFCVRGAPALNDATREDAELVGIPFRVIDNGNRIAGTQIDLLGREAKEALDRADVILAKGQGNIETMYGCGYNVYYAFLVKCPRFIQVFDKPKFTPMLLKERK
ncbi:MAG: DUF89 family protein [Oscillospiraceae bacterium]|nr:DUF89 family protein [Oscillospiraceae bacterium]